jgi:hypothetical protein
MPSERAEDGVDEINRTRQVYLYAVSILLHSGKNPKHVASHWKRILLCLGSLTDVTQPAVSSSFKVVPSRSLIQEMPQC